MLLIISPWLVYFIIGTLYVLTPFTPFPHTLPMSTTSLFSVFISSVFCFFVVCLFDSTYKWDHYFLLSLSNYTQYNGPSMLSQMTGFPSFLWLINMPLYVYATYSLMIVCISVCTLLQLTGWALQWPDCLVQLPSSILIFSIQRIAGIINLSNS